MSDAPGFCCVECNAVLSESDAEEGEICSECYEQIHGRLHAEEHFPNAGWPAPVFDAKVNLVAEGEAIAKILAALDSLPVGPSLGRVLAAVTSLVSPPPAKEDLSLLRRSVICDPGTNGVVVENLRRLAEIQGVGDDEEGPP